MTEIKKFKVASGEVKECVQDAKGNWVTPNKGWLVQLAGGELLAGCEEHVEPVTVDEASLPQNNTTWTILKIKEFMDLHEISYNSGDTKLDLVNKSRLHFGFEVLSA